MNRRVILVHGLWLRAWAMKLIARRLAARGYEPEMFSYATTTRPCAEAINRLRTSIGQAPAHLVGHSLGGRVIMEAIAEDRHPAGRVVLLGSPLNGSRTAGFLSGLPLGQNLLGCSAELLRSQARGPSADWEVGMIAGHRRVGLGVLAGGGRFPGDGTVAVEETQAGWLTDHLLLPESHTSLQMSGSVASQIANFLDTGRFGPVRT